ncbi:hypothetical protein [Gymnodinialimonas hymeniacidonis]|uniref:hypothetical protein n=1 Tax=Gymnodinialimonas hymeniacidonis TaxID=3126508 RepID=UPI0034C6051D
MQILYILRGCFFAYFVAATLFGILAAIDGPVDPSGAIFLAYMFGLVAALPFALAALLIWGVLAWRGVTATPRKTAMICAGVFFFAGLALAIADGETMVIWISLVVAPLLGAGLGLAFWFGAFGCAREMPMGREMPMEWWDRC